ncbi:MAG: hypothetical protein ACFNUH_06735 [Bacteroidota bacterium]
MYPLDRMSTILWAAEVKRAEQGDEAAKANLASENNLRQEQKQPTVEEELRQILQKR